MDSISISKRKAVFGIIVTVLIVGTVLLTGRGESPQERLIFIPNAKRTHCPNCHKIVRGEAAQSALQMLLPIDTSVYSCNEIPAEGVTYATDYHRKMLDFLNHLRKTNRPITEGHSGQEEVESQYRFYHKLAQEPWVNTICETGFNAGHSAFQWLISSKNTTKLFSFDMCEHDYTNPMADYIKKAFPDRFNIICGDSTQTLPQAVATLGDKCDLVIVDGGHIYDVAMADLLNFEKLANPRHHIVVLDDNPGLPGVMSAWRDVKMSNLVSELFICSASKLRGFAVGLYGRKVQS